ncbi:MAG: hypothetical protein QW057_02625 [Candidatus Bathyarchaeia archaeon]
MKPGKEWLTTRKLRVALLGPIQVKETERLTDEEITTLKRRSRLGKGG